MLFLPKTPMHPDAVRLKQLATFISDDYTVYVNGESCEVRNCRVSAVPFNCLWPGHQRPIEQSEPASYINFYSDEEVTLKVTCRREFKKATVRPLSKNVEISRDGQELTFTLKEPGGYVLEADGEHYALHIFYNAPRNYPDKDKATYYFGPGVHFPGLITLNDNESVYIDPEAIVFASVFSKGAENVHIFGGGVMDDSCEERITEDCYNGNSKGNIRIYNGKNVIIEDVILLNSANWVLALFDCDNVTIDSIKITGQWRYNTDGIDLVNTSNVMLKNSFVRSFDDTVAVKALYNHSACENITVENCVLWCNWGKTLELGLETAAAEYRNINYKNCNLIRNSTGALAVSNGNYADIHDIHYDNIYVEYPADVMSEQYQESDDSVYVGKARAMADLLRILNSKFAVGYDYIQIADERDLNYGICRDITYKNIYVYVDEGLPMPKINFVSQSPDVKIHGITIDGLFINGKRITDINELDTRLKNAESIDLK